MHTDTTDNPSSEKLSVTPLVAHEESTLESNNQTIRFPLLEMLDELLARDGGRVTHSALRTALHGQNLEELVSSEEHAITNIVAIAERLSMRVERFMLSTAEAAQKANHKHPLATPLANGREWLILQGQSWYKYQVATRGKSCVFSAQQLAAQLGNASLQTPRPWIGIHNMNSMHATHEEHHDQKPIRRLWNMLLLDRNDLGVITIFAAVISLLSLATPLAVESLVNTIAFGRLLQPLIVLSTLLLVFLGFAAVLRALQSWVAEIIQRRIFVRVVSDLAWRLPRAKYEEYDQTHGPELLNRFFDVMTVQKAAAGLVLDGIAIVLQVFIGMAVLAFYHPFLLGFDIVLLITMIGVVWLLGRGAVKSAIEESKAKYKVAGWLQEIARCSLSFKSPVGADWAALKVDELASEYISSRKKHFRILMGQISFALGLQALAGSVLFGIGGFLVISGQLTLGQLVAAELIVAVVVGSFAKLGKHMESFYDLLAAVDKLGHLFDLPVERQSGLTMAPSQAPARITVQDLKYEFANGELGLTDTTFSAEPGEIVSISGPTGSGKSTLLELLYALRNPTTGFIEIDGQDLKDLHPQEYRKSVTLVQGVEIVTATIWENLTINNSNPSRALLTGTLQDLGLREPFRAFPQGLQTTLLANGSPLSEQQQVLLMLARAMTSDARLLLIDGLLDRLPHNSITRVFKCLEMLRTKMTVIITTSRQEVLQYCDRRVVLSQTTSLTGAVIGSTAAYFS
jgi:putative ABC transport system ATP-binding protein